MKNFLLLSCSLLSPYLVTAAPKKTIEAIQVAIKNGKLEYHVFEHETLNNGSVHVRKDYYTTERPAGFVVCRESYWHAGKRIATDNALFLGMATMASIAGHFYLNRPESEGGDIGESKDKQRNRGTSLQHFKKQLSGDFPLAFTLGISACGGIIHFPKIAHDLYELMTKGRRYYVVPQNKNENSSGSSLLDGLADVLKK